MLTSTKIIEAQIYHIHFYLNLKIIYSRPKTFLNNETSIKHHNTNIIIIKTFCTPEQSLYPKFITFDIANHKTLHRKTRNTRITTISKFKNARQSQKPKCKQYTKTPNFRSKTLRILPPKVPRIRSDRENSKKLTKLTANGGVPLWHFLRKWPRFESATEGCISALTFQPVITGGMARRWLELPMNIQRKLIKLGFELERLIYSEALLGHMANLVFSFGDGVRHIQIMF